MDKIDNPPSIGSITIKSIPILLNKSGFKFPSSLIRRILVEFSLKVKIYRSCGGIGHAGSGLVPRFPDPKLSASITSVSLFTNASTCLHSPSKCALYFLLPSNTRRIGCLCNSFSSLFHPAFTPHFSSRYHSSPAEYGSLRRWSGTRKKIFKRFPFTDSVIGFVGCPGENERSATRRTRCFCYVRFFVSLVRVSTVFHTTVHFFLSFRRIFRLRGFRRN